MTDIRDLILNEEENMDKTAEQESKSSDITEHIKIAEQLEALSEDDTLADDLIKVGIFNEYVKHISKEKVNDDE